MVVGGRGASSKSEAGVGVVVVVVVPRVTSLGGGIGGGAMDRVTVEGAGLDSLLEGMMALLRRAMGVLEGRWTGFGGGGSAVSAAPTVVSTPPFFSARAASSSSR